MVNIKFLFLATILLTLCACTDTKSPVLSENICIAAHVEHDVILMPITTSCGTNCTTVTMQMLPVDNVVCDLAIDYQYPNPDYIRE